MVAGVAGAVLIALLTWVYGFTAHDLQSAVESRRRRLTRLGHVLAAFSFGLAGVAGIVASTGVRTSSSTPAADIEALHARVNQLRSTLQSFGSTAERRGQGSASPTTTANSAPSPTANSAPSPPKSPAIVRDEPPTLTEGAAVTAQKLGPSARPVLEALATLKDDAARQSALPSDTTSADDENADD
jgi:hypothetical protein